MKRYFTLMIVLFLFFMPGPVHAEDKHELTDLYIHAFIHEDGSATITEKRQMTVSEGTEGFIVMKNIGKSKITDFRVWKDGHEYSYEEDWEQEWSRERKANHHSIVKVPDGYELVWGLGSYGSFEYELQYRISNYVKELEDAQMIYWYFVSDGTNIPPQNVKVEIESDKAFEYGDEKIWGYGFKGNIEFEDGKIVSESVRPLREKDYVVILTQLQKGTFHPDEKLDQTFKEVKREADRDKDKKLTPFQMIIGLILLGFFYYCLFHLWPRIISILFAAVVNPISRRYFFKDPPVKYPGESLDEVPFKDHFTYIYALLNDEKLSNLYHLTTTFVVKWYLEDRLDILTVHRKQFFITRKKDGFKVLRKDHLGFTKLEASFFDLFIEAQGDKGNFTLKELKKVLNKHPRFIGKLHNKMHEASVDYMEEAGFIVVTKRKNLFNWWSKYRLTEQGKLLRKDIYLFMNFARNFAVEHDDHDLSEDALRDYFIWASYTGLNETLKDQLNLADLPPNYSLPYARMFTVIKAINSFSTSVTTSAGGGFGGATSSGGGRGASGGGGGGTR